MYIKAGPSELGVYSDLFLLVAKENNEILLLVDTAKLLATPAKEGRRTSMRQRQPLVQSVVSKTMAKLV